MHAVVGIIEFEAGGNVPLDDCRPGDEATLDGLLGQLASRVNNAKSESVAGRRNRIQQALAQSVQIPANLSLLAADLNAQTALLVARIAAAKAAGT